MFLRIFQYCFDILSIFVSIITVFRTLLFMNKRLNKLGGAEVDNGLTGGWPTPFIIARCGLRLESDRYALRICNIAFAQF